jgi:hypothetical protein
MDDDDRYDAEANGFQDQDRPEDKSLKKQVKIKYMIGFCCCLVVVLGLVIGVVVAGKGQADSLTEVATVSPAPSPRLGLFLPPASDIPPSTPVAPSIPPRPVGTEEPAEWPTKAPITKEPTKEPSMTPTNFPTATPVPTQSLPENVTLLVESDTSIRSGDFAAESFGKEDSLLVFNGGFEDLAGNSTPGIFSSFVLLSFDIRNLPPLDQMLGNSEHSATLTVAHVASIVERPSLDITVVRLQPTRLRVETLFGQIFPQPTDGVDGPTVTITNSDSLIQFDITDLLFDPNFWSSRRALNRQRNLQQEDKLLIMLHARGSGTDEGEEFRSREFQGGDLAPQILVQFPLDGTPANNGAAPAPPIPLPTAQPSQISTTSAPSQGSTISSSAPSPKAVQGFSVPNLNN